MSNNCSTDQKGVATPSALRDILNGWDPKTNYYCITQDDFFESEEMYIRLQGVSNQDNPFNNILHKVSKGRPLGEICFVRQGLRTGADKVTKSHLKNHRFEAGKPGEGIFIISDDELKKMKLDDKEKTIVKKFFKNSDIKRYYTKKESTRNILYIDKNYDENLLRKEYSNIYNHLLKFKKLMEKLRDRNNEKISQWMTLDRPREERIFVVPKIVAPQRSLSNNFGYNETNWYTSADVYFIIEKENAITLKYILSLLNSKLYYIYLYFKGKRKGDYLELYQKPLSEIRHCSKI